MSMKYKLINKTGYLSISGENQGILDDYLQDDGTFILDVIEYGEGDSMGFVPDLPTIPAISYKEWQYFEKVEEVTGPQPIGYVIPQTTYNVIFNITEYKHASVVHDACRRTSLHFTLSDSGVTVGGFQNKAAAQSFYNACIKEIGV